MGMDLSNVNLLSLQTKYMQQDPTTKALCAALQPQFQQLADEVKLCIIYANIDGLESEALNQLAYDMHVDFYDSSLSLDKCRTLVKNALKWHMYKGTPAAVEEVLNAAFDESWLQEWFEYGGVPYMFKITTTDRVINQDKITKLTQAINSVKRKSAHLESITIQRDNLNNMYFGGTVHVGKTHKIST